MDVDVYPRHLNAMAEDDDEYEDEDEDTYGKCLLASASVREVFTANDARREGPSRKPRGNDVGPRRATHATP